MKIRKLLLFLSLTMASTAIANDVHPSIPVEQIPLNDTTVSWQDEGMVIMEDGKGFVAMYNTPHGIYFQVLVKDRRLQQQFLRQGLVVYVDPNGKKKKKYAVHFPVMERPKRGEGPRRERPKGENGRRHRDFSERDTAGMFGDIKPMGPRDRQRHQQSKEERARMLKMLVSQLASQPATFYKNDDESILSQDLAKVSVSENNVVFSAFVSFDQLEKIGKKGEISLGITVKERESSEEEPRGGMFGPPPGMMGGMMPPPGMGGPRGDYNQLNEVKSFAEWLVFSTKNTNFTSDK